MPCNEGKVGLNVPRTVEEVEVDVVEEGSGKNEKGKEDHVCCVAVGGFCDDRSFKY